jgi:uncharacterized damage-inducible protein DinB
MLRRDALEELYAYTDFAWDAYAAIFRTLPSAMIIDATPGSGWPSAKDALAHVIEAYDGWLHYVLARGAFLYPTKKDSLDSWERIDDYRRLVRATLRGLLDHTPDEELYRTFTREYDAGEPETLSLADISGNLLLHERGHHGDLNMLLYQLGRKQPGVDYRQYAVARNARRA